MKKSAELCATSTRVGLDQWHTWSKATQMTGVPENPAGLVEMMDRRTREEAIEIGTNDDQNDEGVIRIPEVKIRISTWGLKGPIPAYNKYAYGVRIMGADNRHYSTYIEEVKGQIP